MKLLFGAAYYPEGLSEEIIDFDIAKMKSAGVNTIRLAEFSWSRLEPQENKFDFSWLHSVIKKLAHNNINVIMCTPGATPPKWLTNRYPETLSVRFNGTVSSHGARLHYCPGNKKYRELLKRINKKLAEEFSVYPSVIGWQIDNEVYIPFGEGCFCDSCVKGFKLYLKAKYETIENFNSSLSMTLWSQEYASFEDIPAPRPDTPHHPSLKTEWLLYQDSLVQDYVAQQVLTLKEHTDVPIGTDMMPLPMIDHAKMVKNTDIMMFNHYCNEDSVANIFFWFDYIKSFKDIPWWSTETDPNINGGTYFSAYRPRGFCRLNSYLPYIFGGSANLFWHWRAHKSGHELMHGSVIDSFGRPTYTYDEICKVIKELSVCDDFITNTRPEKAKVALIYSGFSEKFFAHQKVAAISEYRDIVYEYFYRPLIESGTRTDVISPDAQTDDYSVIFSPLLPYLNEGGLADRIINWVKNGGIFIAGPLTDIRNEYCSKGDKPFLHLEDWCDMQLAYSVVPNGNFPFTFCLDGKEYKTEFWADAFDAKADDTLSLYTDKSYEFSGKGVILEKKIGKGKIVVLGTVLTRESFGALAARYISSEEKVCPSCSENVIFVSREGKYSGAIVAEYRNKEGYVILEKSALDLITGKIYEGKVKLMPYDVMVLKYL